MEVVYEDNHIIVVNKAPGEIVQGDKTGDTPLVESVRAYIKEKYAKPGNVFCGLVHRLDRPVAGLVVFARTSKALSRMSPQNLLGDNPQRSPAAAGASHPLDHVCGAQQQKLCFPPSRGRGQGSVAQLQAYRFVRQIPPS